MCISYIKIGQVVPENKALKVVKAYKIHKIYTIYRFIIIISCETCVPDTHTTSVMCEKEMSYA